MTTRHVRRAFVLGLILLGLALFSTVSWLVSVFALESGTEAPRLARLESTSKGESAESSRGLAHGDRIEVAPVAEQTAVEPDRLRVVGRIPGSKAIAPVAGMRLKLEFLPDDFDEAAADAAPTQPLRFDRMTDESGLVALRGLRLGTYEVRSGDDSQILIGYTKSGEFPKACANSIEVDLHSLANEGRELLAADLVAAVAVPIHDRVLTWRTALENAKWWPRRLENTIRAVEVTLANRFPTALTHVGFDCDGVSSTTSGKVDFIVLGARSGISRHAVPFRKLDRLEAPGIADLSPPNRRVSTLLIQTLDARGNPIPVDGLELAFLSAGCDLPHFATPSGVPFEVPPGTYYLHCNDPNHRPEFRKVFPDSFRIGTGDSIHRVVRLR